MYKMLYIGDSPKNQKQNLWKICIKAILLFFPMFVLTSVIAPFTSLPLLLICAITFTVSFMTSKTIFFIVLGIYLILMGCIACVEICSILDIQIKKKPKIQKEHGPVWLFFEKSIRMIGKIFKEIGFFICIVLCLPFLSIFQLFTAFSWVCLIGTFFFVGMVTSFFLNQTIFWILFGIYIAFCFLLMIANAYTKRQETFVGKNKRNDSISGMFDRLSLSEAKKKYHTLMKRYHPDNAENGDPEKAQKIIEEYKQYTQTHK